MTGRARALIVLNFGAAILLTALTAGALSDSRSAVGQGIIAAVLTLSVAPTMQFLLARRGMQLERWWALCVLIPLTTAGLAAAERQFASGGAQLAVGLTVVLLIVSPIMLWRQRRR